MLGVRSVFEASGPGLPVRLLVEPEGPGELRQPEDDVVNEGRTLPEISDKMYCSACQCNFGNREDQTEHYKLDWHRFNLRQRLLGAQPVTADSFEKIAGEISSISGSDSEDSHSDTESDRLYCRNIRNVLCSTSEDPLAEEKPRGRRGHRVLFQSAEGEYLSVYRCILQGKQDSGKCEDEDSLLSSLLSLNPQTIWVVLMTGGGHFAGAVFQGNQILHHKTVHRYTVRAKRGVAQGVRDAQNRSRAPKSAGATLRRYNEAALSKDIEDLLARWSESLQVASAIFLRAPSYNKSIFSGKEPALNRNDSRLRSIPFHTRRATFKEVKRVHAILSTMEIYARDTDVATIHSPERRVWKEKLKPVGKVSGSERDARDIPEEEDDEMAQIESTEASNPGPFSTGEREEAKKQPRNIHVILAGPSIPESEHYRVKNELYTVCKTGNVERLQELLCGVLPLNIQQDCSNQTDSSNQVAESTKKTDQEHRSETCRQMKDGEPRIERHTPGGLTAGSPGKDSSGSAVVTTAMLCETLDEAGSTLLHVAAAAAQRAVLRLLMDSGSDPAIRDKRGRPAYAVSANKETRNEFRRYMADHPGKYNYTKAQISGPLTSEIELKKAEKKRAQKAAKKLREKEQKEEQKRMEEEENEKKRYAAMSEREKRALAAEKRFAQQLVNNGANHNIRRCWLCGQSLLGRVPFEYLDYTFCTTRCLQEHKKQQRL
ncbi:tRNA endonuclease ANKZF1 isoform X4 [Heterodontus francisci]|uniref:tRNA endonuclease ANKZF1 isoform X4 n=1 Tax=Heterodontus francisci TaxID=7792 RepID=UPI00355C8852